MTNRGMVLSPLVSPRSPCFVLCPPVDLPSLSAGAGLDGHVGVNLEHWIPAFILVEHSQRTHLLWDAAGLGNSGDDPDGSDYALDGGVVRRPRHLGEFERKRENQ